MDRYDASKYDPSLKIARMYARIDKMNSIVERATSVANAASASAARGYDPGWWAGMRFAEHQYLLDKAHLPMTGLGPVISDALKQVPTIAPTALQFDGWAQNLLGPSQQVGSIFSKMNSFVGSMGDSMSAVAGAVANAERIFETIRVPEFTTGLKGMIESLPKLQDFDRFWSAMAPAIEEFRVLMEDARDGDAVLEAAEFGFADHLWDIFYLSDFAHIHPRVRNAVVTKKLATHTSSSVFVDELREEIEASRMMRRRWRVIEAALEAHASRKYDLSVPVFLSQIEGTIGDVMFLKDLVVKEGNKYYLVDHDGNFKLNKKGKRLGAVTLNPALQNARLDEQEELAAASEFMANVMVQRRNDVMHGRDVVYGRAKLSVQALLLLTILVRMVGEMEDSS